MTDNDRKNSHVLADATGDEGPAAKDLARGLGKAEEPPFDPVTPASVEWSKSNYSTEEEAKGKHCPFARALTVANVGPGGVAVVACNRMPNTGALGVATQGERFLTCLGSKCMKWEWLYDPDESADKEPRGRCAAAGGW